MPGRRVPVRIQRAACPVRDTACRVSTSREATQTNCRIGADGQRYGFARLSTVDSRGGGMYYIRHNIRLYYKMVRVCRRGTGGCPAEGQVGVPPRDTPLRASRQAFPPQKEVWRHIAAHRPGRPNVFHCKRWTVVVGADGRVSAVYSCKQTPRHDADQATPSEAAGPAPNRVGGRYRQFGARRSELLEPGYGIPLRAPPHASRSSPAS